LLLVLIVGLWSASLVLLLLLDTSKFQIPLIVSAILCQTLLYRALFITAHDAMHGVVFAKNPNINNWIGRIAVILYALFSYKN
jgi:beta-carotene ketolase (CrtW type)